jgi:hypothetical protein
MVRARCARVSSRRRILRSFDAQWRGARGGRAERPLASAVQRVRVQPLLVLQESAQGQGDLPLLIAFRPRPDRPGMKEDVAPKRFQIVHPVKRFRPWNAAGRQHVVSPFSRWERYRTASHRWLSMADGGADHAAVHYRLAGQYCSVTKISGNCPLKACRSSHGPRRLFVQGQLQFDPSHPLRQVYYRPRGETLLATVGTGNARRLCPLDMNLLQCPNSPGTEELSR